MLSGLVRLGRSGRGGRRSAPITDSAVHDSPATCFRTSRERAPPDVIDLVTLAITRRLVLAGSAALPALASRRQHRSPMRVEQSSDVRANPSCRNRSRPIVNRNCPVIEAERAAAAARTTSRTSRSSMWVEGVATVRRSCAGMQRGPWRLSGRLGIRSRV